MIRFHALPLAALITFGLFAWMASLVQLGGRAPMVAAPPTLPDLVFDRQDAEPRVAPPRTLPPKPEVLSPPQTPPRGTDDPGPGWGAPTHLDPPERPTLSPPTDGFAPSGATPLVRIPPRYPMEQARAGTEGYVVLSFRLSASGEVRDIQVVEAQPKRAFERAAIAALRQWRYRPGQDTDIRLQVRLDFTLAPEAP
ncbi:energy transducer TonB [Ferrimonas balearica]|uniref:energy transducer TonB n=1 Tax=Ferrimonas balearica TaxID=44012 RepID=UPI001C9A0059|nr:energy transducer TonB [Ferrimonas balearica]MBY5992481.1 TonB family protein [Ferrimonas balearica]